MKKSRLLSTLVAGTTLISIVPLVASCTTTNISTTNKRSIKLNNLWNTNAVKNIDIHDTEIEARKYHKSDVDQVQWMDGEEVSSAANSECTTIGQSAFSFCSGLTSFDMPAALTTLGDSAFLSCTHLESINLSYAQDNMAKPGFKYGSSVFRNIGTELSEGTYPKFTFQISNKELTADERNQFALIIGSLIYAGAPRTAIAEFKDKSGQTYDYSSDENLTFLGNTVVPLQLMNFDITEESITLTSFNPKAYKLSSITSEPKYTSIVIPEGVTNVSIEGETSVFTPFKDIVKNIGFVQGKTPNNITTIPDHFFAGFSKLEKIQLPNSLRDVDSEFGESIPALGIGAFEDCPNLAYVDMTQITNDIKIPESCFCGSGVSALSTGLNILWPESANIREIGELAFAEANIYDIGTVPGLETIGEEAFARSSLMGILIPSSVTSIGDYAFQDCTYLQSFNFESPTESQLTSLGTYSLAGCTNLQSVVAPSLLESIGESCFDGCSRLSNFDIQYCTQIETLAQNIGDNAFGNLSTTGTLVMNSYFTPEIGAAVLTLFKEKGLPERWNRNLDDQYAYCLCCTYEPGVKVYFTKGVREGQEDFIFPACEISYDDGSTWETINDSTDPVELPTDKCRILIRSTAHEEKYSYLNGKWNVDPISKKQPGQWGQITFTSDNNAKVRIEGNLVYGLLNAGGSISSIPEDTHFEGIFRDSTAISEVSSNLLGDENSNIGLSKACYKEMFRGCTNLKSAPSLYAKVIENESYAGMFYDCTNLLVAPTMALSNESEAEDMSVGDGGCSQMFKNCRSLELAPDLYAKTLSASSYSEMFIGCDNLLIPCNFNKDAILAESCYADMFRDCKKMQIEENWGFTNATELPPYAFADMFRNCQSITRLPVLPSTITPAELSMAEMFMNCISLTSVSLPMINFGEDVYEPLTKFFYGCENLKLIDCDWTEFKNEDQTLQWVYGVHQPTEEDPGVFYWCGGTEKIPYGTNAIPDKWTVYDKSGK